MLCIFCLTENPPGSEHVIPQALGGTLKIDRVCEECNNWLGARVDHLLTDHLFAHFGRSHHGIGDETPSIGKIFGSGTMQMPDGSQVAVNVRGEQYEDEHGERVVPTPRVRPSINRTQNADGTWTIQGQFDASQERHLRAFLRAEYDRIGHTLTDAEFEERFERDVRRVSSHGTVHHEMRIDTARFRIALMKIVYELAAHWLGDEWLSDPAAVRIRDVVLGRSDLDAARIHGYVGLAPLGDYGAREDRGNAIWPLAKEFHDRIHRL